jgi:hypothetical protein
MSDRVPMNEAAARRAAEAAAQQAVSPKQEAAAAPARKRPPRKPFGSREQKLAYPNREGYHRHWFNDEPGRIARALEAGYKHVTDESGKNVTTTVGVARGGGGLTAYLMEIPLEWYREDMTAQEADYQALMSQIKQGRPPGGPSGQDGQAQYVPRDRGIVIREERR